MNSLARSVIAAPVFAFFAISGGDSIAALPPTSHVASTATTLSLSGFLDFKTLIFSSGSGENLDGVSDQIKIIGPELFRNAALRHGMLQKFKSSPKPVLSTSPIWGWEHEHELDVLNVERYGKPSAASSELIDAILGDIRDNIRNHGISGSLNPSIGTGTTTYLNAATQKVMGLIDKLESSVPAVPMTSNGDPASQPIVKTSHLLLVSVLGIALVTIGLLRRRLRKKALPSVRHADPAACFDIIRNSPIQYAAKSG